MLRARLLLCLSILVWTSLSASALPQAGRQRPASDAAPKVDQPQKSRTVTISLKHDAPVTGRFVQADENTVKIEVAGNLLSINLDDVSNIAFSGDAGSPSKSNPAREVIKELKALDAAAQVGINYRDYSSRLIEAKIRLDELFKELPEGEAKKDLSEAWELYIKTGEVWRLSLSVQHTAQLDAEIKNTLSASWNKARDLTDKASKLVD
jgi:hypothetical protein